jgi:hypothetical protein
MSGVTQLPEHVRRAIYGETTEDEKRQACNKSLSNWCAASNAPTRGASAT